MLAKCISAEMYGGGEKSSTYYIFSCYCLSFTKTIRSPVDWEEAVEYTDCISAKGYSQLQRLSWIYRLKRCGNNNKDEDNSTKTLNYKNVMLFHGKLTLHFCLDIISYGIILYS